MDARSRKLEKLAEEAASFHGHLCSGLYMGVRMAVAAEELLDIDSREERFIVEVETDRCPADGILIAAGTSIGRRRFKMLDYGKCAARFYDAETGKGIRLYFKCNLVPGKGDDVAGFFSGIGDDVLFSVKGVKKDFHDYDLPGPMISEVVCLDCGETVQDRRELESEGAVLCRECFGKRRAYTF